MTIIPPADDEPERERPLEEIVVDPEPRDKPKQKPPADKREMKKRKKRRRWL